jgi:RHS repeat-associated protein
VRYPEAAGSGDQSQQAHTQRPGDTLQYFYQNGQLTKIDIEATSTTASRPLYAVNGRHAYGMITDATYYGGTTVNSQWTYDPNTLRMATQHVTSGTTSGPVPDQQFTYYANGTQSDKRASDYLEHFAYDGATDFLKTYHRQNAANNASIVDATFSVGAQGMTLLDTTNSNGSSDWPNVDETYTYVNGSTPGRKYELATQAIGTTTHAFVYDSFGRVQSVTQNASEIRHYNWNSLGKPTQIQDFQTSTTRTYKYDAFGNRTRKIQDTNNRILYVGKAYEQRNLPAYSKTETVYRVFGEMGQLFEISHAWGSTSNRNIRPVFTDDQGSIAYKVDVAGVSGQRGFFPYGKRMGTPLTFKYSDVGYGGHLQDDDFDLIDMRGRMYDVVARRFLSRDVVPDQPLKTFGSQPYSYVGNNPTNLVDPSGFSSTTSPGVGVGWDDEHGSQPQGHFIETVGPPAEQPIEIHGPVPDSIYMKVYKCHAATAWFDRQMESYGGRMMLSMERQLVTPTPTPTPAPTAQPVASSSASSGYDVFDWSNGYDPLTGAGLNDGALERGLIVAGATAGIMGAGLLAVEVAGAAAAAEALGTEALAGEAIAGGGEVAIASTVPLEAAVEVGVGATAGGALIGVAKAVSQDGPGSGSGTKGAPPKASSRVQNSANHVFGPKSLAKHGLQRVLKVFGGDKVAAFNALERGAQQAANKGAIKGVFQTTVDVAGQSVTVRGAVVHGVAKVGTAFIP